MKQEKVKDQNKVENTNDFKFKNDHEKLNDFHEEEKVKVSKENYKNDEKLKDKDKSNKRITKVEINEKDEKQKDNEKSEKNKIIRKDIDENSKDKDKIERNVDKEFFHEKDNFNSFEKEKKKNIKFENSDDFKEKRKDMDDKKSNVRNSKKFNDNSFGNKERKNSKGDISKSEEKHSHIKEYSRHHEFSIEDSQSSFKKGVEKSSKKQDSYINFKVLVRVRPFIKNEIEKGKVVFVNPRDDKNIKLGKNSSYFEFSYEKIFGPFSTQKDIFRSIKNSIDHVINGINSTILLYGQTGSGKTYTMFGSDWTKNERLDNINDISGKSESINSINNKRDDLSELIINPFSEENGFLPRIINYLFSELEILNIKSKKYNVYVSFLQIYNESINDLLDEVQNYDKQNSLRIREDKVNGIYVENITEFLVENVYDCLNLMKRGYKSKKYRQIKKNVLVSRSHTIFQIIVEYDRVNEKGILKRSKLNVCDLAGSEKIEYDKEKISQDQLNEMIKINLSLSTLGQVIHALSIAQNHVPYRDSKLTRFLQDSLRCDTLTYLISTISPSWDSFEESINTLKFADIAKNVKTKIKFSNLDIYDENSIKNLKEEILNLRDILHIRKKRGNITAQEQEILELKTENQKLKEYVLLNTEIQKIVKENKFLKIKLSKYENSDYLELTHNKTNDTNLIEIKEQGKLDPKYSDKLKYYVSQEHDENCISDKMDINYIKKVPKYNNDEKYQNNYDQNDYLKQIENYNYKDDSTYLHHNKKKLFHKQLSPKEKSNELYLNNINSKSFNYKGKIQEKSYQINDINKSNYNHQYLTPTNMISQNNNMKKNENFYKHNPNSNIFVKGADMVLRKINNEYDEREMKSNYRLRILEKLEYETGLNLKNEIEKIQFEKKNLKEENWIKSVEKKKKYERIDSSINKIKYLYDNKNQDQSCKNIYLPNYYDINHNEKNHSSDKRRTKYNYENSDDDFDTLIKKNNLKYKNNKNISNNQNDRQYGESNYDDEANWKKSEIIRNNDENTQFRIN